MSDNYDVIIIGAGSVGTPAAHAMAKAGLKVLVIDCFASSGQGSNKAAIGGVRATHSDPAKIRLCLRSLEIFKAMKEKYGHDIEWETGGYCFVAYRQEDEQAFKELLRVQKSYGLHIDWYDAEELLQIVPSLNPEGLRGGTYSPEDGCCSTLLASHAFFVEARRAGAVFHFKETLTAIRTQNGRVIGVQTDKGEYGAPVVVNAAGGWAKQVGAMLGLEHPVMPDSHEAGITEPVARFLKPMLVDIRPGPGSANYYFYQLNTGQVVFCITPNPNIWGYDCRETSAFLPMIARRMVNLVPCLTNIRVRRTWRGLYPMTPDGAPLVGWAREVTGYLMAIGMCGQGFMIGPGLGELLARMICQSQISADDQIILDGLNPYRAFKEMEKLK
ncbi:MAG: FAD-binding oxidoreductase [Anaerolineae bacterium]|nr:FAD-binding oxidoreductase [Anaerolineae bacterium]